MTGEKVKVSVLVVDVINVLPLTVFILDISYISHVF